jgi:bifunctional UDP-N-acetylglucosamine pyrophosphorylase/glucosamine-1-phosphate N-acetyltransferase
MAAGRGSRMENFSGNKVVLPLVPGSSVYQGEVPILVEIIRSLPEGPKTVVVHHRKQDIINATSHLDITYCEQPELNGTGGALLAAREFVEAQECRGIIISMGDVPFVKRSTYCELVKKLDHETMVVLGFYPESKKQYGVLETRDGRVKRIIEWQYWKEFPEDTQDNFKLCNSGIYAVRKDDLLHYISVLASRPHRVKKNIDGKLTEISEYFITDLVEYMVEDDVPIGYVAADDEEEVMGIDDFSALERAQGIYRSRNS